MQIKFEKIDVKKVLRDYFMLTMACFFFAMAWECFLIPNGMGAGGMMGLCTVIQYATAGFIKAQYSYVVINAVLIIIAVLLMGIGFGFKTIYCIAVSTLAMGLIPIVAGVFEAVGIGLVLRYGGSTGGTDIVALMVNKYWPVSLSMAFLVADLVICAMLLFLPDKNFSDMCYALEEVVVFSMMIDTVVGGKRSSYQLMVFSEKYGEIADHIIQNMDRGVTVLKAQGWFTKKEKNVLYILISQRELPSLTKVIRETDPKAFMSVSPTNNVYGEGFEEIKAGMKFGKKKK